MKIFLIVFLFTMISLLVYAQDNKPAYQYWDNRYIDDKIILRFKIDNYELKDTDSLETIISVKNKSNESVFILNRYRLTHSYSPDSTSQTIIIEFGGNYTGEIEFLDELREIEPDGKYYSKIYLKKDDFDFLKNGENFFKFGLSFAYMRSFEILRKNSTLVTFKTHRVSNNVWEANSYVISASLCSEIYLVHYVNFKK